MKRLLAASALAIPLLLSGCATTSMVQVWRDPNYVPVPVKRAFVVAIIPNPQYAVTFENSVAQALVTQGIQCATAAGIFPPGAIDKEKVTEYVKANDVQLVVVMRLTKQTTMQYNPATVSYVPPAPYYGGWYGAYGYGYGGYGTVYSPGYYSEETIVQAESNVYSVATEKLIWSGNSSTFNFSSAQQAAQSVAGSLVTDLAKAGILVK
jgi:hypothetical protein